jgi:GMP synthase-like glutamine amidotransferase
MHLAILRTGQTNAALNGASPDYPEMFVDLLNTAGKHKNISFTFTSFAVFNHELPTDASDFDGYIITGSAAGVYEEHDWLEPLFAFIRACDAIKKPVCGICFGHQAVAKALGGEVEKWPDGWGVGVRDMNINAHTSWMTLKNDYSLIYFHQDQVTKLPQGATSLASSDFCSIGAFAKDQHIFCLQGHPEFPADYSRALLEVIRERVGEDRTKTALNSLSDKTDAAEIALWICDFFLQAQPASRPPLAASLA